MDRECWKIIVRIVFDVLALFLAFLPFILLSVRGAQPFQRGFFCSDESIRYPYRPDSVSAHALFIGTLLISTGIILITEVTRYIHSGCASNEPSQTRRLTSSCSLPSIVFILYRVLGSLYFGFALTLGLMDVGKYSSGRLRPHFWYVCRPDPTSYNCTSPETNQSVYVENFRCFGTNKLALWNARLAFPSGHAALAAYFAVFMLIYLQVRLTWRPVTMLRHVLQAACYAAALYITISRVSDNAHQWSDVVAGAFLGNVIGILVILRVCRILQLASDVAKGEALIQKETTETETSGVGVHPVAQVLTLPNPIERPETAGARLPTTYSKGLDPISVSGGQYNNGFHGNDRGIVAAHGPIQQQQHYHHQHQHQEHPYGMPSSFVRYT